VVPPATTSTLGLVKPDNTTITISGGVISAVAVGLVPLEAHTAVIGTDSELDFTAWYSASFTVYQIIVEDIFPSTSGLTLALQCSTNGGSTYDTGSNYYTSQFSWSTGGSGVGGPGTSTSIPIAPLTGRSLSTSSGYATSGSFMLFGPSSTTLYKRFQGEMFSPDNAQASPQQVRFVAAYLNVAAMNAFRIKVSSGTFAGTVRIYGFTH
jgi:hypothetical protein